MNHTVYLQLHQCLSLPRKRSPDNASPDWGCRHLIAANSSFIDPKGWKAELAWLADLQRTIYPHKWSKRKNWTLFIQCCIDIYWHWHCFECMVVVYNVFTVTVLGLYLCILSTTAYCQCCYKEITWYLAAVSCRSSAGQRRFAGQRPTFYHCRPYHATWFVIKIWNIWLSRKMFVCTILCIGCSSARYDTRFYVDKCKGLYNTGIRRWLTWGNGTGAHYAAVHCLR